MKVAAYVHLRRVRTPTGVGQHIIQMVRGLAACPEMDVEVLAPRGELDSNGRIPADLALAGLPVSPLPLGRRWMEAMWLGLNRPAVERWSPGADWVYCPAEAFVATRRANLAVTVHDTNLLERDLPWLNTPQHIKRRKRWEAIFRPIRRHAKLILAVSEFTKSRLVSLLDMDPAKIAVVGNGVEDAYFAAPGETQSKQEFSDTPYLFVVGGLSQKKGASYLLAVARKLREAEPNMRIVVTGVVESPFDVQADQIGNIRQLGYVDVQRQVGLMRGAVALLMLSRFEGFGIPALEAMAVGTPAIVSQFASLPEVVGNAGIVVNAEQPDAVMESILKVKTDGEFRNQLIVRGREHAGQFHWSAAVARLITALKAAG